MCLARATPLTFHFSLLDNLLLSAVLFSTRRAFHGVNQPVLLDRYEPSFGYPPYVMSHMQRVLDIAL